MDLDLLPRDGLDGRDRHDGGNGKSGCGLGRVVQLPGITIVGHAGGGVWAVSGRCPTCRGWGDPQREVWPRFLIETIRKTSGPVYY